MGLNFNATLLKPCAPEELLATLWYLILQVDNEVTAISGTHWQALALLISEGDVSGIEDWITSCHTAAPDNERVLRWIENRLHRLDFALLERWAIQAAAIPNGRS